MFRGESKFEINTLSVNPTLRFDLTTRSQRQSWSIKFEYSIVDCKECKKRMQSIASKGLTPHPISVDFTLSKARDFDFWLAP